MRQPMTTAPAGFRLHYVDDSGSHASGLVSFTWLQLDPEYWAAAEQTWLAFRRDLYTRYRIPASRPLHATDLAGGRRSPSLDPGWDASEHGADVIVRALEAIGALAGIAVGTVFTRIGSDGFHAAKSGLYRRLTDLLDGDLRQRGQHGLVVMDGDGSDPSYAAAHRALPVSRRLIEAPVFRLSETDQWVQMADIAAWTGFQALRRRRVHGRKLWGWYRSRLGHLDLFGGPREL